MKARIGLVVAVLALLAIGWAAGLHSYVTPEGIRGLVERAGWLGPVVFVALFAAAELVQVPGALLVLAAAALWPPALAIATSYAGALVAATLLFWLSRTIFAGAVRERLPAWVAQYETWLETHGLLSVIALRLVLFLAPWVHWLLGASRVTFRDFALGSAIGLLPGIVLVTLVGRSAIENWDSVRPWALAAGALVLAFELARRLRARQSQSG
jgi:phospholipase D1/2